MTTATAAKPSSASSNPHLFPLLKPLLCLLPISLLLFFLLSLSKTPSTTTTTSNPNPNLSTDFSDADIAGSPEIRIRPGYRSYKDYIARQLNKTLDPRLRRIWTTRDWERKVAVFSAFFRRLQSENLLSNSSAALCVGARTGQEVAALRRVGVSDSIGLDLVPAPPLVVAGDFHRQPFPDESFDFEFSNVFDHALFPARFAAEVERTLRPGGVCVIHVAIRRRGDKYSANDLFSVEALVRLFRESELVRVRRVDGFGLDTEVVLRKKWKEEEKSSAAEAAAAERIRGQLRRRRS